MLSGFLKSLEFCQEIDSSTLEVVSSNLISNSPSSSSEPLLFFPALVKLEHPEEYTKRQDIFFFGWLLSCVKEHQFLSTHFINILL